MSKTAREAFRDGNTDGAAQLSGWPVLSVLSPQPLPAGDRARQGAPAPEERLANRDAVIEREARVWLARELHDVVLQSLSGMLVDIECFKREQHGRAGSLRQLEDLRKEARRALDDLRDILSDLRDDRDRGTGFVEAVRSLGARFESRTGIAVALRVAAWPSQLPSQVGLHLHRIIEEALSNVRFHSGAAAVEVSLVGHPTWLEVTIRDEGRGGVRGESTCAGMGIRGMRERADLVGGRILVHSEAGRGTVVDVRIPLEAAS